MPPDAKVWAGGGLVVVGFVLIGALVWGALRPLKGAGENVGQTAEHLTQGVEYVAAGVEDVGGGVGNTLSVAGGMFQAQQSIQQDPTKWHESRSDLHLQVLNKEVLKGSWRGIVEKRNEVTVIVTVDGGSPVRGATVIGRPTNAATRTHLGTFKLITDGMGVARTSYAIGDFLGINSLDDVAWQASHPTFNASNVVVSG